MCVGTVKCGCAPVLRLLHGSCHLRKHVGKFWYMDRVGVAVSADDTVRVESPKYGNRGHGGGGGGGRKVEGAGFYPRGGDVEVLCLSLKFPAPRSFTTACVDLLCFGGS